MNVYGKEQTKTTLRRYVGDMHQLAGAISFTYNDGKANGLDAVELRNGTGLRIVVLAGRCLDIVQAEYKGVPFSYLSKAGITASERYDKEDFLRTFSAGLLTTCGLRNTGISCTDEDEFLPQHGRLSNLPAEQVNIKEEWLDDGRFAVSVSGKIRESRVFGENLVLTRTITLYMGDNRIHIHDEVENEGFDASPLMLLYHINLGYPLLTEDAVLTTNCTDIWAQKELAIADLGISTVFDPPTHGYMERCFFRNAPAEAVATLTNDELGMRVSVAFSGEQLPYLTEWKQMGEQEYVVGIEPGTYIPCPRPEARKRGKLQTIAPQETRAFDVVIGVE